MKVAILHTLYVNQSNYINIHYFVIVVIGTFTFLPFLKMYVCVCVCFAVDLCRSYFNQQLERLNLAEVITSLVHPQA